jgi:hypothetical protein
MIEIKERLRKAVAEQRHPRAEHPPFAGDAQIEAAFRPVSEAAEELHRELADVPGLTIAVEPGQVRIELHDKQLWFSYAPETCRFVGSEVTSLWMEGGLHEEHFAWETAEACIEAMIQACARYVSLAEIIASFPSG